MTVWCDDIIIELRRLITVLSHCASAGCLGEQVHHRVCHAPRNVRVGAMHSVAFLREPNSRVRFSNRPNAHCVKPMTVLQHCAPINCASDPTAQINLECIHTEYTTCRCGHNVCQYGLCSTFIQNFVYEVHFTDNAVFGTP